MKAKNIELTEQSFNTLIHVGHCVPRNNDYNTMEYKFKVGKKYTVSFGSKTAQVICTQDCPCNLRITSN